MSLRQRKWARDVIVGIVGSIVGGLITGPLGYREGQASVASKMAEGLAILDVPGTLATLDTIVASSETAVGLTGTHAPRRATEIIQKLRAEFSALNDEIGAVKTTEFYSITELTQLAGNVGMWSDKKAIIDTHVGETEAHAYWIDIREAAPGNNGRVAGKFGSTIGARTCD